MRKGRQTPTSSHVLPSTDTLYKEAEFLYNKTDKELREWQSLLLKDIMAINSQNLWSHSKFGYEVSRRNGKGEVLIAREIWGLVNGEKILHTAHQVPTSRSAWERICQALDELGLPYKSTKQYGSETVTIPETKAKISFRTRTSKSGLGEGYDLLVVDEAQEYTIDQESALKYIVSASKNPQTILCGTPPTATSSGTVFAKMRDQVLQGQGHNSGWAEWSVDEMTDPNDIDAWYETNPSLGTGLTERVIEDEIGINKIDFNIQRLGLWLKYNQKSAISEREWDRLEVESIPRFIGQLFVGIKYSKNDSVSMSVAIKTNDERIYVEGIDCQSISSGNDWLLRYLENIDAKDIGKIVIDGDGKKDILIEKLKTQKKVGHIPTVKEIVIANAQFEQSLYQKEICHGVQPSMRQIVTNCEKRAIGSNGGFGYKSILDNADISLMDSMILAFYGAKNHVEKAKMKVMY